MPDLRLFLDRFLFVVNLLVRWLSGDTIKLVVDAVKQKAKKLLSVLLRCVAAELRCYSGQFLFQSTYHNYTVFCLMGLLNQAAV